MTLESRIRINSWRDLKMEFLRSKEREKEATTIAKRYGRKSFVRIKRFYEGNMLSIFLPHLF